MKFLCIECDQAMKLKNTQGPDEGSMAVIFSCPKCSKEFAMLTNPMETQMVQALNVKIGGRKDSVQPMETVKNSLMYNENGNTISDQVADTHEINDPSSGSKCPFSDVVSNAVEENRMNTHKLKWTKEAEMRIERIPSFARSMATMGIEQHAREKGYKVIDDSVMDEVKDKYGM